VQKLPTGDRSDAGVPESQRGPSESAGAPPNYLPSIPNPEPLSPASQVYERIRSSSPSDDLGSHWLPKIPDRLEPGDTVHDRLGDTNRIEREFLAGMSHELRTPLHSIIGFSELLLSKDSHNLTGDQREYLADIFNSGNQVLLLINDFLEFSAAAAGKLRIAPEPFSPLRVLEEVGSVLRLDLRRKHQVVGYQVGPGLETVILDPLRFRQVVLNLLSNAIKFSDDGARIELALDVGELAGTVRLRVTDRGIGIAAENLHRLFRPFERLHPSPDHPGTGLGLFLTKQLVDAQGGHIDVESESGQGTAITVVLPTSSVPTVGTGPWTREIS
jgi:signal transduction histidine kinase